ncbi:MAG: homoserine dehydrogenase, partial [Mesorhizobium sp.]
AGETFDAIGETCYRSWTMTVEEARANRAVPVGLLEGGMVLRLVSKGELLTSANAAPDPTTRLFALRRLQDEMLYGLG